MYDLIGDIHGHADELRGLLGRLGYDESRGYFAHPSDRQVVFVGDFIDRGPKIAQVLKIVRKMVSEGSALAVMGNHEFNAIAYHTPDADRPGQFLRPHTDKNDGQHGATLAQLTSSELQESVAWFRGLPMWLELDGLRVVHACWDPEHLEVIATARELYGGCTTAFMLEATTGPARTKGNPSLQTAIEIVLKGREAKLPPGSSYQDKDGNRRGNFRVKWYEPPAGRSYRDYVLASDVILPDSPLQDDIIAAARPYPGQAPPVFFGHYWLRGRQAERLAPNVACLDYSVAKGGMLCAYRWDGEHVLDNGKFVTNVA